VQTKFRKNRRLKEPVKHAGHTVSNLGEFSSPKLPDGWDRRAQGISMPALEWEAAKALGPRVRGAIIRLALSEPELMARANEKAKESYRGTQPG
jgi:hypothetical protein